MAELSGRTVNYGYDALYRLTSETIANDAAGNNGTISYVYDAVGNRLQRNSTVAAVPTTGLLYYDANDRMATDTYDPNGNTVSSAGIQNVYDFENHLIQHGFVTIVYDGDGNRVAETVGGVTTNYLVDTQNPTGHAQVMEELENGSVARTYTWGLALISKLETGNSQLSFYGFDGHGSVRQLTDASGAVTDTYDYDAFGNLINQTGSTPNNYLFAGEQYDPALGLYYNRSRYLDVRVGRFWGMDGFEGYSRDPLSLHKYLYATADPVNHVDPTGKQINDVTAALGAILTIASTALPQLINILNSVYLNLWRLPLIVNEVIQYATLASGTIQILHGASQAMPELAQNLLSADQEYSPGWCTRGFQCENAAGVNLSPTNRDFDDFRYSELTQLKSTTQVQTKELLLSNIRAAAQKVADTKGPYRLYLRGGGFRLVQEAEVTSKNLLYVVPDEALTFTQQSLVPALQEVEESTGVQIGVQAVRGLRGQP